MTYVFRLFVVIFFAFPFPPFLIFLLQWLTFYWACCPFRNVRESIIETGNFYRGIAACVVAENFAMSFSLKFLSIFVHISVSIEPITLIWVSLERYFLLHKLSIDNANFGQRWWRQKWSKGQARHELGLRKGRRKQFKTLQLWQFLIDGEANLGWVIKLILENATRI